MIQLGSTEFLLGTWVALLFSRAKKRRVSKAAVYSWPVDVLQSF